MCKSWQPIETAPKDGTPVLLLSPSFQPGDYGNIKGGLVWVSGGWRNLGNGWRNDYGKEDPTYWMPLPEAPGEMTAKK